MQFYGTFDRTSNALRKNTDGGVKESEIKEFLL